MKKMILTLVAVIAISSTALAQDQQGPRPERKFSKTEMAKHRTDEMAKEYKLSDKQAKQLQALNEKYADKMGGPRHGHHHHGHLGMKPPKDDKRPEAKKTDGTTQATPQQPPKEGKRPELTEEQKKQMEAEHKQMETTRKAYDAELQKIMTADQFKQYQEDMKKRGPRGHHGPRPPRDGEKK